MKSIKTYLLVIIGTISLILGTIGIIIPILPTTPFILLASFCYIRSSNRLYYWLINHKLFGKYIYDYLVHKSVKKSAKITAITLLWLSLGITIYLINSYISFILIFIGIVVSIHIISLKTLPTDAK
ncbi:MAG: YbaN family protein [Tissierellia bacterium]|nr:YbaN family protein [Tissierellia bacterium]MDD4678898.1 YbaN family protein [Tissierellia bacterium]